MSLKPSPIQPVPEETARVARAAFRKGNPLLSLRDELGAIFADADFADLFPKLGQPGLPPWRLALVTLLQFRENLPDRQAAEAVRARIDWKYLLGLELADPGFDHSVLCEFRSRLLAGSAEERLLDKLLEACQARGLLKARGRQRTDATHVAGVHPRAEPAGAGRRDLARGPERAGHRGPGLAARRRPGGLVQALRAPRRGRPAAAGRGRARGLRPHGRRGRVRAARPARPAGGARGPAVGCRRSRCCGGSGRATSCASRLGRLRAAGACGSGRKDDPPPAAEPVESPYDPEARFRTRSGTSWTGYVVHLSETCEDDAVHLITHAMTTVATVHEAQVHRRDPPSAWLGKGLAPGEHLVDAAYVDAELLVRGREELGIDLVGPPRPNPSWQGKVEGGYTIDRFEVDWDEQRVRCPQGKLSSAWSPQVDHAGTPYVSVMFRQADCAACPARPLCTRAEHQARHLKLQPRAEHEALKAAARAARAPRRGGAATPGGPGSRAPSRKACAPSGCAAAATAGWPGPTCSTWRPRPRSTSTASPPGSGRSRAPPPAPRASPPSPLEPTSPTVSGRF